MIARDPFFMMSGALGGIIATASGLDVYDPSLAFVMGFAGGALIKPCYNWLEKRGIDDAVGAVTVHGTIGLFGLIMFGVWGSGLPALQGDGVATVSIFGQLVGAVVFFLLGFVPGYVISWILKALGMLRGQRRSRDCWFGYDQGPDAGLSGGHRSFGHPCRITIRTRSQYNGI